MKQRHQLPAPTLACSASLGSAASSSSIVAEAMRAFSACGTAGRAVLAQLAPAAVHLRPRPAAPRLQLPRSHSCPRRRSRRPATPRCYFRRRRFHSQQPALPRRVPTTGCRLAMAAVAAAHAGSTHTVATIHTVAKLPCTLPACATAAPASSAPPPASTHLDGLDLRLDLLAALRAVRHQRLSLLDDGRELGLGLLLLVALIGGQLHGCGRRARGGRGGSGGRLHRRQALLSLLRLFLLICLLLILLPQSWTPYHLPAICPCRSSTSPPSCPLRPCRSLS